MMARSNEPRPEVGYIDARPHTASSMKPSCNARPDHTLGQTRRINHASDMSARGVEEDVSVCCRWRRAPIRRAQILDAVPPFSPPLRQLSMEVIRDASEKLYTDSTGSWRLLVSKR